MKTFKHRIIGVIAIIVGGAGLIYLGAERGHFLAYMLGLIVWNVCELRDDLSNRKKDDE